MLMYQWIAAKNLCHPCVCSLFSLSPFVTHAHLCLRYELTFSCVSSSDYTSIWWDQLVVLMEGKHFLLVLLGLQREYDSSSMVYTLCGLSSLRSGSNLKSKDFPHIIISMMHETVFTITITIVMMMIDDDDDDDD